MSSSCPLAPKLGKKAKVKKSLSVIPENTSQYVVLDSTVVNLCVKSAGQRQSNRLRL